MESTFWEVQHTAPPETTRYCKKCGGKTAHVSSGLFRVNAQQKSLDIWLVYRCVHCKNTWNLAIYSRVGPKSIPADVLHKCMQNDPALAQQYAMDTALLKKNGAQTQPPPCRVAGSAVDPAKHTRVTLICRYPSEIKVSKIVREKLSLSSKAFEEMVAAGMVRQENGADIRKSRVQNNLVLLFGSGCSEKG